MIELSCQFTAGRYLSEYEVDYKISNNMGFESHFSLQFLKHFKLDGHVRMKISKCNCVVSNMTEVKLKWVVSYIENSGFCD